MTNGKIWSIDLGLYSVQTRDDVPQIMRFGRDCCNFFTIRDLNGRVILVNATNILTVKEAEGEDNNMNQIVRSTLASFGFGITAPKTETIELSDEEVSE